MSKLHGIPYKEEQIQNKKNVCFCLERTEAITVNFAAGKQALFVFTLAFNCWKRVAIFQAASPNYCSNFL